MKISHEVPLCLLEDSKEFNDYQYCLPRLMDEHPKYNNHFMDYTKDGGFVIMDNGLFEGHVHTEEDLIEKINQLKPNIFIIPDDWDNPTLTYHNAKRWVDLKKANQIPQYVQLMAVLQFNNFTEAFELYKKLTNIGITHIAFNHSSSGYKKIFPHKNKLVSQMMGRVLLVNRLMEQGILVETNYHHLLGCSLAQEFVYYKGYDFIKSVDTSNPISMAYENLMYTDIKDPFKPSSTILEMIDQPIQNFHGLVDVNVDMFRRAVNGN